MKIYLFLERFYKAKDIGEKNKNSSKYEHNNLIYITCLPWMRITSMMHPVDEKNKDSIPRICWGKYFETIDGYNIDMSIQVNHGFQDGYHLGLFYEGLERNISNLKNINVEEITQFLQNSKLNKKESDNLKRLMK